VVQGPGQDRRQPRAALETGGPRLNRPSKVQSGDDLFAEANRLVELGRTDEARDAYLKVLSVDNAHEGALNNLGGLLYDTGFRSAARTAYRQAVALHPHRPMAHINLGNLLRAEGALDEALDAFKTALAIAPGEPEAHRGLGQTLDDLGQRQQAWPHHEAAYRGRAVRELPWRGRGTPLRVLTPVAAVGGNIPTRFILDPDRVQQIAVVAEFADPAKPLPAHDLVFNTVGDADLCGVALDRLEPLLARTSAPVINPPSRVRATGRAALAAALAAIEGVRTPAMLSLPHASWLDGRALVQWDSIGLGFPLLLRAEGFHTGQHFVRIERPGDLAAAAATLPGETLIAIEPLDARGPDGRYRKYRVMSLGGRLYPLHLAVSRQWKVHYFTAAMAEDAAFRAEEAAFLHDMGAALGPAAVAALERVASVLGLDYAGMDFAIGADGRVLLFEANATMVINPPEPDPIWDYRRPAIERALAAARALISR
jgi:tetratricopeptide (TPR) repeat protein